MYAETTSAYFFTLVFVLPATLSRTPLDLCWASVMQHSKYDIYIYIYIYNIAMFALQWRHNDHDGVSNHQPHGCLLNHLIRRRSKKTSELRVTGLCMGNSPGPVNSPHKWPVTRIMFPFDDVIMCQFPNSLILMHIVAGSTVKNELLYLKMSY